MIAYSNLLLDAMPTIVTLSVFFSFCLSFLALFLVTHTSRKKFKKQ